MASCSDERKKQIDTVYQLAVRMLRETCRKDSTQDDTPAFVPHCSPRKAATCMVNLGVNISYHETSRISVREICR